MISEYPSELVLFSLIQRGVLNGWFFPVSAIPHTPTGLGVPKLHNRSEAIAIQPILSFRVLSEEIFFKNS